MNLYKTFCEKKIISSEHEFFKEFWETFLLKTHCVICKKNQREFLQDLQILFHKKFIKE